MLRTSSRSLFGEYEFAEREQILLVVDTCCGFSFAFVTPSPVMLARQSPSTTPSREKCDSSINLEEVSLLLINYRLPRRTDRRW